MLMEMYTREESEAGWRDAGHLHPTPSCVQPGKTSHASGLLLTGEMGTLLLPRGVFERIK